MAVFVFAFGCGESSDENVELVEMLEDDRVRMPNDSSIETAPEMSSDMPIVMVDDAMEDEEPASMDTPMDIPMDNRPDETMILRAFDWLNGRFDSSEQARQNPAFFSIQLESCRVNAPEIGAHVLYVEQASMRSLGEPYRQRLYHVTGTETGEITSTIYSLNNPGSAIGLCARDGIADFRITDVTERTGCTVFLTWTGDEFTGGTRGEECSSRLGGASYATSEVVLRADALESWDRGFDSNGLQVWGATEGAYIFVRRDREPVMPDPMPVPAGQGETCEDALSLQDDSLAMEDPEGPYTHRIDGQFGISNDYNPLEASGLAPGCSIVYDALGNDVVYSVDVEPGDVFSFRLTMPAGSAGGLYFLDSCENGTWPDNDLSGACGRAEYRSHGNCDFNDCSPLEWQFEWPTAVDGQPTEPTTLFLVVDEVQTNQAQDFQLEWSKTSLD